MFGWLSYAGDVALARKKTAQLAMTQDQPCPEPQLPENHVFVNQASAGSVEEPVLRPLRAKRVLPKKHWVSTEPGNWGADFTLACEIVCDPLHPKNQWKYLVEKLLIDGEPYLRLVDSIPLKVKENWDQSHRPPTVSLAWGSHRTDPERPVKVSSKPNKQTGPGDMSEEDRKAREEWRQQEEDARRLLDDPDLNRNPSD